MARRALGKGVSCAHYSSRPLRKCRDCRVMPGHFSILPPNFPPCLSQPHAKLRLFARDHFRGISACLRNGGEPHQCVSSTRLRFAHGRVPFAITKPIIDRRLWMPFPSAAADHRDVRILCQNLFRLLNPGGIQLAVAINELHELRGIWPQGLDSGISCARSGEWNADIQFHYRDAQLSGPTHAVIGRPGININDPSNLALQALQTGDQSRTFIAPDYHRVGDRALA